MNIYESNKLLYADNMVIFDSSFEKLSARLKAIGSHLSALRLFVNGKKYGFMCCNEDSIPRVKNSRLLCQQEIAFTDNYKYLGIKMTTGFSRSDIEMSCMDASNRVNDMLINLFNKLKLPISAKILLIKCLFYPSLTYGLEIYGHIQDSIKKRTQLLEHMLKYISFTYTNVGHQLLYLEYNIMPTYITYIKRS